MTKFTLSCVIVFALLSVLNLDASAESWRGITPIYSTRANVQKLLGKAHYIFDDVDRYEFDDFIVRFDYVSEPCGGFSDFGDYNVAKDTVLEIEVEPVKKLSLKRFLKNLNVANMNKPETSNEMCTGIIHYTDKERGFGFAVNSDKTIYSYTFGAKAADSYLICQEDSEEKQ